MQRYTVYLYLETALHVLGGISTHHQERIQMYLQHLLFVTPSLLSAAVVKKFECAVDGVRHPQHTQTGSNVLLLCITFLRVLVVLYLRVTCMCVA
jgi:hypothetical protein